MHIDNPEPIENYTDTRPEYYTKKDLPIDVPPVMSVWEHTSGRMYRVMALANIPNDERYPLTIIYMDDAGNLWTRPYSDWHRSMKLFAPIRMEFELATFANALANSVDAVAGKDLTPLMGLILLDRMRQDEARKA